MAVLSQSDNSSTSFTVAKIQIIIYWSTAEVELADDTRLGLVSQVGQGPDLNEFEYYTLKSST